MRKRKRSTGSVMILIACVVLCLVAVTTWMTGGIFAKYYRQGSIPDGARVMKFGEISVSEPGISTSQAVGRKSFRMIPGVPIEKEATVTFAGAESSVYVFVTVEADNWTASSDHASFTTCSGKISWGINVSSWTYLTTDSDTEAYVYYAELAPNETLEAVEILADSRILVSDGLLRSEIELLPDDLMINFRAFAVQGNGFSSADAAWQTIRDLLCEDRAFGRQSDDYPGQQ